jgi:hypothetical protein
VVGAGGASGAAAHKIVTGTDEALKSKMFLDLT